MKLIYYILFLFFVGCTSKTSEQSNIPLNEYGNPGYVIRFNPKRYVCYRTPGLIAIDGNASEDAWQVIPWNIEFCDILGEHFPKPSFLTRAKMLWDDNYIYVAVEMKEPHVRASKGTDDLLVNNNFSILFDVNGNAYNYHEFVVDAKGSYLIKTYKSPNSEGVMWSDGKSAQVGVMEHVEGTLNNSIDEDYYWSIEVAFPIRMLIGNKKGNKPGIKGQWRINFKRTQWNAIVVDGFYKKEIDPETGMIYPQENWVWSPMGANDIYKPELWGFVQFSDIKAGREREVFLYNPDEDVKWELRNVFYAQKRFFELNGEYAKRFGTLKSVGFIPKALNFNPKMDQHDKCFNVKAITPDKKRVWCINQDGLVWDENVRDK